MFNSKIKEKNIHVFIGYDDREQMEFKTCRESILDNASRPVSIYPLKHRVLRDIGLFKREWKINSQGIMEDVDDQRPFTTHFSHSRFCVPLYARYLGLRETDVPIFMDSDFVVLQDIYKILPEIENNEEALWVVKHDYSPTNTTKMDGQPQSTYSKKLWSSFMAYNLSSSLCGPSLGEVNEKPGSWLHSFSWLPSDDFIGSLNEGWNFIPNHSEPRILDGDIKAIHYTEGTPEMKPGCKYSAVYNHYKRKILEKELNEG